MSQIYLSSNSTPAVATTYTPDDGVPAVPVANNLNIVGGIGGNIKTFGAGSTITISEESYHIISSYTSVEFGDSPYTVLADDFYISVDTSGGAVTILLPDTTDTRREFEIKDRTGNTPANNITVTTVSGAVTIDGLTSQVLGDAYESIDLIFNSSTYEVF